MFDKLFEGLLTYKDLIYDMLNLGSLLEKKLFDICKTNIIMLDGFDEIKVCHIKIVTNIIQNLKEKANTIWITTRKNMQQHLEDKFNVLSFALKPFTNIKEQKSLLMAIWERKLLNDNISGSEGKLETFINTIINAFIESTTTRNKDFLIIPLHLVMVAEIFYENKNEEQKLGLSCKDFILNECEIQNPVLGKFDVADLYKRFIETKYGKHCKEKLKVDPSKPGNLNKKYFKTFLTNYQNIAAYRIFSSDTLGKIFYNQENAMDFINSITSENDENFGIIDGIVKEMPNFVHFTYAEYLASFPIAEKIIDSYLKNDNFNEVLHCITKVTSSTFLMICIIKNLKEHSKIQDVLEKTSLLSFFVKKGSLKFIEAILEREPDEHLKIDHIKKTPLHYAAESGYDTVMSNLLNHYNNEIFKNVFELQYFQEDLSKMFNLETFINTEDGSGKSALSYYTQNKSFNYNILFNIINNSRCLTDTKRLDILKKLFESISDKVDISCIDFKFILKMCILFGHIEAFIHFIKYDIKKSYRFYLHCAFTCCQDKIAKYLMSEYKDLIETKGENLLLLAIQSNANLKVLNYIVDTYIDIETNPDEIKSVLVLTLKKRNNRVLKYLINKGAKIDMIYESENLYPNLNRLFDCCCYFRYNEEQIYDNDLIDLYHKECSKTLNQIKPIDCTKLCNALDENDFEKFKFFIRNSEFGNYTYDQDILLKKACELGEERYLQLLFQKGVTFNFGNSFNVEYKNDYGKTHIPWLLETISKMFCLRTVVPKSSQFGPYKNTSLEENPMLYILNVRNTFQQTLLHKAAEDEEEATIKKLLDLNAYFSLIKLQWEHTKNKKYAAYENYEPLSLDAVDSCGNTVLHILASKGKGILVSRFLRSGAIYNIKNNNECTPEDMARNNNKMDCARRLKAVRDLFKKTTDKNCSLDKKLYTLQCINAKNEKKDTLLHLAVSSKNIDMFKILLEKAVDLNSRDLDGSTPLHLAVEHDQPQMVELLLRKGAYFNITDIYECTPLNYAMNDPIDCVLNLIQVLFDTILSEFPFKILKKLSSDEMKSCIFFDTVINAKDEKGNTLLHYAVQFGYVKIVKSLLGFGSNFDSKNQIGDTPLAMANPKPEIKYFLELTEKLYSECTESVQMNDGYFKQAVEKLGIKIVEAVFKKAKKASLLENLKKGNVNDVHELEMSATINNSRSNQKKRPFENGEHEKAKRKSINPVDTHQSLPGVDKDTHN